MSYAKEFGEEHPRCDQPSKAAVVPLRLILFTNDVLVEHFHLSYYVGMVLSHAGRLRNADMPKIANDDVRNSKVLILTSLYLISMICLGRESGSFYCHRSNKKSGEMLSFVMKACPNAQRNDFKMILKDFL